MTPFLKVTDRAELIYQHGAAQPLLVGEDVIEQGGLACSEEDGSRLTGTETNCSPIEPPMNEDGALSA